MNALWDWAILGLKQGNHIYYAAFAQDIFAFVRSYGREQRVLRRE